MNNFIQKIKSIKIKKENVENVFKVMLGSIILLHLISPFLVYFFLKHFKDESSRSMLSYYREKYDGQVIKEKKYIDFSRKQLIDKVAPILSIEDHYFMFHSGIDPRAFIIALRGALFYGSDGYGGSTITQQLARTLFLFPDKMYLRKYVEIYITLWVEVFLSKEEILKMYINNIEFGPGVYGVERGSFYHFNKPFLELNEDQRYKLYSIIINPLEFTTNDVFNVNKLRYRYNAIKKFNRFDEFLLGIKR